MNPSLPIVYLYPTTVNTDLTASIDQCDAVMYNFDETTAPSFSSPGTFVRTTVQSFFPEQYSRRTKFPPSGFSTHVPVGTILELTGSRECHIHDKSRREAGIEGFVGRKFIVGYAHGPVASAPAPRILENKSQNLSLLEAGIAFYGLRSKEAVAMPNNVYLRVCRK